MQLTAEQKRIIHSEHSRIRVNSFSGTGKTETIVALMRTTPKEKRKLYITFSKKMTDEAKIKLRGIDNIDIRSAYSLAYKFSGYMFRGRIKNELNIYDYSRILDFKLENHLDYEKINMIKDLFTYWMSSKMFHKEGFAYYEKYLESNKIKYKLDIINNLKILHNEIFSEHYSGMISHLLYLKIWQLSKNHNQLKYEYDVIVIDEIQDLNESFCYIIDNSEVEKIVAVGDAYQEIYMFSGQKGGMSYFCDWKDYFLTNSFRFGKEVADISNNLLSCFSGNKINIKGKNSKQEIVPTEESINYENDKKYVLFRKNISMFDYIYNEIVKKNKKFFIESSTGSLIYNHKYLEDIYALKYFGIKSELKIINRFENYEELKSYYMFSSYKNHEIGVCLYLIDLFLEDTMKNMKLICSCKTSYDEADVIVAVLHQIKGKSIDLPLFLYNDFISVEDIYEEIKVNGVENIYERIKEEIFILYVAITRSSYKLICNENTINLINELEKINKIINIGE